MSCFLLIHTWMITYCMFQEIHHHILKVLIKDTNLYFLTMWVFCKGLHINNQKQNNQKWNIHVWSMDKEPQTHQNLYFNHFIPYPIHCVVLCLCVECLGSHWQQKQISSWAIRCTYSKLCTGVLKQWSCPNEFISSWGQTLSMIHLPWNWGKKISSDTSTKRHLDTYYCWSVRALSCL